MTELNLFLIYPLGLEEVGLKELKEKWELYISKTLPKYEMKQGGIELQDAPIVSLQLNHILKIPTRILLRITDFTCRDLPKLFKKCSEIKWNEYLLCDQVEFQVTAKKSRILHTKKIEQSIRSSVEKYFKGSDIKKKYLPLLKEKPASTLFVRFEDDHCTISIDTSGERLNIRGKRTQVNEAPLRENFAAALFQATKEYLDPSKSYELIDPMCGGGTILLEVHDYYEPTERKMSYHYFPFILKLSLPKVRLKEEAPSYIENFQGYDISQKTIGAAKNNLEGTAINLDIRDVLQEHKSEEKQRIIVCNPPYGMRIKMPKKFYQNAIKMIVKNYRPELVGFLIPRGLEEQIKYKIVDKISFSNCGIPVYYILFRPS